MSDHQDVIDRYFAAWNEPDAGRRRALLEQAFTADGRYRDPAAGAQGAAAIAEMMGAVRQRFPGMALARAGDIDAHNGQARFPWTLGKDGEEPVVRGVDFVEIAADGRLAAVIGFFDHVAIPQAA